jgi:hypothetical protein
VNGPKRFIEYAEDVTCQLVKHDLVHHLFADDTQRMLHCLPADVPLMMLTLNECFVDVSGWCASKRLQLNENKTEMLIFGTAASLKKIPLGSDVMQAGSSAQLTMRYHVSRTKQACFFSSASAASSLSVTRS